jgi:uncharacterized protein (DUF58 family)
MSDAAAGESAGGTARRWRLRLTRAGLLWLAATLILGLVVWFKNLNLLVFLAYLMLVLLVLNGVLAWLQVRRTAVTRLPLAPVHAGERVHRRVRVRNAGQRPATVSIIERGEQTLEWFLSRLPAGGDVECMEWAVFLRRGRFGRQPPVIASEFPLGLVRCERDGEPGDEIIVLPAVGAVDAPSLKRWLVRQGGSEGQSRKVPRQDTTEPADVRGVRPYRPGDSMQWIHWKSSARRGELMVREFDAAPSPELLLVVEPWLPESASAADRGRLERALSMAASLFRTWCLSLETKAALVIAGQPSIVMSGPPNAHFARSALVPLADVEGLPAVPLPESTDFGASLRRSARVVVSSRPGSTFADELTRMTGKTFVALDPAKEPDWYQPPRHA